MGGSAEKRTKRGLAEKKRKPGRKNGEEKRNREENRQEKKKEKQRGETRLGSHANREKERKGLRVRLQRQFAKPSQKLCNIPPIID
jgi:hypothetical protein